MLKLFSKTILIFLTVLIFSACKKEAGEGGTSRINGRIYAKYYDKKTLDSLGEGYAPDERIYIIYGNNTSVSNDTRSDYDGNYSFEFLHKGSYTVYAYSDCDTCGTGVQEVKVNVEITKNRQTVDAPTINIDRKRQ